MPGIMIAAVKSGSGKTTITCALLEQLKKRGLSPVSFKCGPDYIDPMFHKKVLHVPSENLDPFFSDEAGLRRLYAKRQGDIAVVEGVMGLYDGLGGIRREGSSYEVAKALGIPIILIVDAKGMGNSIIPLLAGFLAYDKEHLIKGVFLNRTGKHFAEVIGEEIQKELSIPVVGCLPVQKSTVVQSRHLGLWLPEEIEDMEAQISKNGEALEENTDLNALLHIAETAETPEQVMETPKTAETPEQTMAVSESAQNEKEVSMSMEKPCSVRIAVAKDEAFCFYYENNLELIRSFGAELVWFSPLHDRKLPENISGLLLGGGYPELYAEALSANYSMRESIKAAVLQGIPCVAECGGFMYLHERLVNENKEIFEMAGVIPAECFYTGKLVRFGYLELKEKESHFLPGNTSIRGHEFHYYDSSLNGDACVAVKPVSGVNWECVHAKEQQFFGFPHLYYGSNPKFAEHFVEMAGKYPTIEKEGCGEEIL